MNWTDIASNYRKARATCVTTILNVRSRRLKHSVLLLWQRFTKTVTVFGDRSAWISKRVPSAHAIKTCVRNFETTGSTLKKFRTQVLMEQHDCDESWTLFEIHAERSPNCHRICKTLSQQKHVVLQSTTPLQLKRFKVGSKMAMAVSAPVLPNQKKTVLQNRPIHWRTLYIIRYTSCIYMYYLYNIALEEWSSTFFAMKAIFAFCMILAGRSVPTL